MQNTPPGAAYSGLADPIVQGLARGWKVFGGAQPAAAAVLWCDVVIVGTGAGGGISAELLTAAGLRVVLIEEGPLKSSSDFRQLESEAYPSLYQESAGRKTADKAINILQGRCVGGSTTVNWTSSFRTPSSTLQFWREHFELPGLTDDASLLEHAGLAVELVAGSEDNIKLTYPEDLLRLERVLTPALSPPATLSPRVGTGFDVHRFEMRRPQWRARA